jgi:hypothetical protein
MTNENNDPTTDHEPQSDVDHTPSRGGLLPSRRRVLQALGGAAATLAFAGNASADEIDDDVIEYTPDENQRPEGPLGEGRGISYSRMSDQVTDGSYVIVDEGNITTEEGGFMSVHIARPEEGIADVGFINEVDGSPQNAAATIIGYSEYLEPGVHQNIEVPIFQDEELQAVSEDMDRLEEPTVLVSLPHVDSNENQEWDFFDEGDPDGAYGFDEIGAPTDGSFAPPGPDRPTDIAAVVPLEENVDQFHISRPRDGFHDGRVDDEGEVVDDGDDDGDDGKDD